LPCVVWFGFLRASRRFDAASTGLIDELWRARPRIPAKTTMRSNSQWLSGFRSLVICFVKSLILSIGIGVYNGFGEKAWCIPRCRITTHSFHLAVLPWIYFIVLFWGRGLPTAQHAVRVVVCLAMRAAMNDYSMSFSRVFGLTERISAGHCTRSKEAVRNRLKTYSRSSRAKRTSFRFVVRIKKGRDHDDKQRKVRFRQLSDKSLRGHPYTW
jgi:hypothetical protein